MQTAVADGNQLAYRAAQQAARESYGRLVAILARRTRDVAQAEDALAEAFAAALKQWPHNGVPDNPNGWLIAVAKRKHIDTTRKNKSHVDAASHLLLLAEELEDMATSAHSIPDERLALMFACAHPALDANIRSPLILQTVLGLTAEQIASAFLVSPATMGQRLARAKAKIRLAGIPFRVPDAEEWGDRLETVLEAIYAAFAQSWSGTDHTQGVLVDEALWLGKLVVQLLPDEAECLGLRALMLFVHARANARRTGDGNFVPLSKQDVGLWDSVKIDEAEELLRRAAARGMIGRYQLEAAIQSAHVARRVTGTTDWPAIAQLYEVLFQLTSSAVVKLNWAVAVAEALEPEAGIALLPDPLQHPELAGFQPYHAVCADLFAKAGFLDAALTSYDRAIALENDSAVRNFLTARTILLRSRLQ